jgi:hypothetical protein
MKQVSRRFLCVSAALAISASAATAQNVISAKSGLVHYIEGDVTVDGTPVSDKMGTFAEVKKDRELDTAAGRAEVLLTPGVFLRVGEQSAIRMLSTALADTRVEMVSGNAMVEADTPMKDNLVTIVYKGYETTFTKHGVYEFQTEPAQLKVYSGEAMVSAGSQTVTVHEGHLLAFTAALAQERFDNKNGDSLYRWSKVRSEYISVANVSAAKSAGSGYGNGYLSSPLGGAGSWYYNSFYGMYTFLPYGGISYSPFGYPYFSPGAVYQAYNYYPSGGGITSSSSRASSSATGSAAPVKSTLPGWSSGMGASSGIGAGHAGGISGGHGK